MTVKQLPLLKERHGPRPRRRQRCEAPCVRAGAPHLVGAASPMLLLLVLLVLLLLLVLLPPIINWDLVVCQVSHR